jgi:hypothetical protein
MIITVGPHHTHVLLRSRLGWWGERPREPSLHSHFFLQKIGVVTNYGFGPFMLNSPHDCFAIIGNRSAPMSLWDI